MNDVTEFRAPTRPGKPRKDGRTNLLDSGWGLGPLRSQLEVASDFVDLSKIGWGTALVLSDIRDRIALYNEFDIEVCLGGTMFEYAFVTDQLEAYRRWVAELGLKTVEISDGTIDMEPERKLECIGFFAADFEVLSEVGSKDSTAIVSPARWVAAIKAELQAGASAVILEGREAGNAGLYRASGEMRTGLVDEILESGVAAQDLIFETPVKEHQVYLLQLLGANVNLANIAVDDAVPLETLRLGLRSDTLASMHSNEVSGQIT